MTNLIAAYQKNDIMEFEKILKVCYLDAPFYSALDFLCTCTCLIVNEFLAEQ
jgi:hypothetical protein